jgi:hypothetical protein
MFESTRGKGPGLGCMMNSRNMTWSGHVENLKGGPLGRPWYRWENDFKVNLEER